MAAVSLCVVNNSLENYKIPSDLCDSACQHGIDMEKDIQLHSTIEEGEAKSTNEARNNPNEDEPRGGKSTLWSYDEVPRDKQRKFCEGCKNIESALNDMKLELSSCKEIIRILQEEIREITSPHLSHGNKTHENSTNMDSNNTTTNGAWAIHSSRRYKHSQFFRRNTHQPPVETSNRFTTLTNLNADNECTSETTNNKLTNPVCVQNLTLVRKNNPANNQSNKPPHKKTHKVLVIGDSHARLCATKIKSEIKSNFCVQGMVKPGVGAGVLVNSCHSDIKHLTKDDVVIFMGGANDVAKNNSQTAIKHIRNFLNTNKHTNIIVANVPHRYDLMQTSCVNNEIESFNRKLWKHAKAHQHVSTLEINNDRTLYTTHGQHLNGLGKDKLVNQLVSLTHNILHHQKVPAIILRGIPDQNPSISLHKENVANRASTRAKKTPLTKYSDFLL